MSQPQLSMDELEAAMQLREREARIPVPQLTASWAALSPATLPNTAPAISPEPPG